VKPTNKHKKLKVKSLHTSNFALGFRPNEYGTKYDDSFTPFSKNIKGKSKFGDGMQRKSNFGLGRMGNNYMSEFAKK
jgi:hypothetical protein